jgi:hypothetical protein
MSVQIPVNVNGVAARINPGYNLRFVFPELVRQALLNLTQDRWEPWYKKYLESQNIREEQLIQAWACYGSYARACLQGLDSSLSGTAQASPLDALENSGFLGCPDPCKLVILAKVGQLLTATFWQVARDGSYAGEAPPDLVELDAMSSVLLYRLLQAPVVR